MNEEEFKGKLKEAAVKMREKGASKEQIQSFVDSKKAEYVKKKEQQEPMESSTKDVSTGGGMDNGVGEKTPASDANVEYVPPLIRRKEDVDAQDMGMSTKDYKISEATGSSMSMFSSLLFFSPDSNVIKFTF